MVAVKGYHRKSYTVKGHDVKPYTRKAAKTTKKGSRRKRTRQASL